MTSRFAGRGVVGLSIAVALAACGRPRVPPELEVDANGLAKQAEALAPERDEGRPESPPEVWVATTNNATNAALSPTGEPHPGTILHDDKVDGRTWTTRADEVPPTLGWVRVGERWVAVTRIEISGTAAQRRITKFAYDGAMLETTIQAPRPAPAPLPRGPETGPGE